mmetsp:Transcript_21993/g.37521  ORF Transcript_21993/g.37521 Transcript_21993/m.37521 type:complete len:245 (-) Transcript_21993:80-814(-)
MFQLFLSGSSSGWVVGTAEVDNIGTGSALDVREEIVLSIAWHVHNVVVLVSFFVDFSSLTHHDRSINVHRVRRILNSGNNSRSKYLLNSHNITLGSITDKDFIGLDDSIVQFIGNLGTQISHTLLSTISRVTFLGTKLGSRAHKSRKDVLRNGLGGITNSKRDDSASHLGIFLEVCITTTSNFGEKVPSDEFAKVGVTSHLGCSEGSGSTCVGGGWSKGRCRCEHKEGESASELHVGVLVADKC